MKKISISIIISIFIIYSGYSVKISGTVTDKQTKQSIPKALVVLIDQSTHKRDSVVADNYGNWKFDQTVTDVETNIPTNQIELSQNFPNPFKTTTSFSFSVNISGLTEFIVYNQLGQLIDYQRLDLSTGSYSMKWNAKGTKGVYFLMLRTPFHSVTKKMILTSDANGRGFVDLQFSSFHQLKKVTSTPVIIIVSKSGYYADTTKIAVEEGSNLPLFLSTIHNHAIMADLHNDVLMKCVASNYDLKNSHTYNHTDIPRLKTGGVDIQIFAVYNDENQSYQKAKYMIDVFNNEMNINKTIIQQARTAGEALEIVNNEKIAAVLAVEGGHQIEDDINNLITFYKAGMRYMTITWNNSTDWAVSSQDSRSQFTGLNDFGKKVIQTMDSLGVIIDVSHTGIKTIEDILKTTKNPIIASHSGARALRDHYRNLTDDQIVAIAKSGGVIGVPFYPSFLTNGGTATISSVIKHINYIVSLVGIDYVGIGTDFDGIGTTPVGLEDCSKFPALTQALIQSGYSNNEIEKILGKNFLRVFEKVCGKKVRKTWN